MANSLPVSLDDVEAARRRLIGAIVETDCDWSRTLSAILGCRIWLKFENLQFTASFKERGALNRLSALSEKERRLGVIAMSAGRCSPAGHAPLAGRTQCPARITRRLGISRSTTAWSPPWNRISGKLKRPSQMWARIHTVPRPTRQVGTLRRAPSSPAKSMNAKPTMPKPRPIHVPPLGPLSAARA